VFDIILRRVPWVVAAVMVLAVTGQAALAGTDDGISPSAVANVNADRVDGRHAIKYTSNTTARKGRLMAIGATGYLPNNIIQKAMDADMIDGIDSTALATIAALQSSAGAVNEADNLVHWNQLFGVPPTIADGVDAADTTVSLMGPTKTLAASETNFLYIVYPASRAIAYELIPVDGAIVTEGDIIARDANNIAKAVIFTNFSAVNPVTVKVRLTDWNSSYVSPTALKKRVHATILDKLPKRFSR